MAHGRRTTAEGLAAADSCLARVVATLPAGWDQADALAGADATMGTADDGVVAAPSGCTALLVPGPLGTARPFLDVAAAVPDGGRRLRAVVDGAPEPSPAVVWSTGGSLGFVPGRVELDGVDPARTGLAALPAVASPGDPAAIDAWLAATPGVVVLGQTAAAAYAPAPPLAGGMLATRLVAAGAAPVFVAAPVPPPATLHLVPGDLTIATPGHGTGLLAVEGRLDIQADFAFSGVVVASGGVAVASGTTLRIAGSLWVGAPALDVAGTLAVRHDRAALDAADARFRLPRRAAVAGLMDR